MADEFFYKQDASAPEFGPIPASILKQFAEGGQITKETLIKKGDGAWTPASAVKGLFASAESKAPEVAKPVAPVAPVTPVQPPKPEAKPAPGGLDLSGLKVSPKKPGGVGKKKEKPATAPAPPVAKAAEPIPAATPTVAPAVEPSPAVAAGLGKPSGKAGRAPKPKTKTGGGLGSLFSFNTMIAPNVIKTVYFVLIVLLILGWLGFSTVPVIMGLIFGGNLVSLLMGAAVSFVVGGIGVLLYIIMIRISCEVVLIFFQINDNLEDLKETIQAEEIS